MLQTRRSLSVRERLQAFLEEECMQRTEAPRAR